jgi:precorrin-2 dehydrogenase/sirohydrochlorin ferrochelatase
MDAFPAFFPLSGARVVIAGDGEGAEAKARLFAGSPAEVVRLTGEATLDPGAYAGAKLVFVASYDEAYARAAAAAARAGGAPLNVVDRPELSDFHTPAIVDRGTVVAAIGTAGAAPLLASLLRAEIELRVPAGAGRMAALLASRRDALREAFADLPARRAFLRAMLASPVAVAVEAGDLALAEARLDRAIRAGHTAVGRASFVTAPASADLISVRCVRVLNTVDILVVGEGSEAIVAAHARRDAEHWASPDVTEEAIAGQAAAGRLIALVDRRPDLDLMRRLAARGVAVEHLAPAPPGNAPPGDAPLGEGPSGRTSGP